MCLTLFTDFLGCVQGPRTRMVQVRPRNIGDTIASLTPLSPRRFLNVVSILSDNMGPSCLDP